MQTEEKKQLDSLDFNQVGAWEPGEKEKIKSLLKQSQGLQRKTFLEERHKRLNPDKYK